MATVEASVSDLLVIVKSREIQRARLAAARHDAITANRHFLAAAHLELVLADDYAQASADDLAIRSRISAASCFWCGGELDRARKLLDRITQENPQCASTVQEVMADLAQNTSRPSA